jgi:acyl-coenzyme A synthetase/AMP-(fatty) acid ligase
MTGLEIKEGFGQIETVVFAATFPCMQVKPGSLGKPSAGWCVDIVVAGENNSCDPGQEGRLIIRTGKHRPGGIGILQKIKRWQEMLGTTAYM